MEQFKSFKLIFKNAMNRQPMPFVRRVQAVWHMALIIAVCGMIAMAIFTWFLYAKIKNDTLFQSQASTTQVSDLIKQTSLEAVLKEFDAKAENFNTISFTKPKISDPSL